MHKKHICSIVFFIVFGLVSCTKGSSEKFKLTISGELVLHVLDTIKISSNNFIEYVDFSPHTNQLILYEWGSQQIIVYDINSHTTLRLTIFGSDHEELGMDFVAGAIIDDGGSLLIVTERGYFEYSLVYGSLVKLFDLDTDKVHGVYRKMISLGDANWLFLGAICPNKKVESIGYDYYSKDYMQGVRFFTRVDLIRQEQFCDIGYDQRSIQLTADEAHRAFPDGGIYFGEYESDKLILTSNADNKLFIYQQSKGSQSQMIYYKLKNKERPPFTTAQVGELNNNLISIRNGRLSSLIGTVSGEIIICYNHALPDAPDDFVHDIISLRRSCVLIDGQRSSDRWTFQSREFELPQGIAGFLTKLNTDTTYLLANDAVHNEQFNQNYFYIVSLNKAKY